jgi:hypothetical protein
MAEKCKQCAGSRFWINCLAIIALAFIAYLFLLPVETSSISAKQEYFLGSNLWSSNTVDPTKTSFSTVVLSGTCQLNASGYAASSSPFEIAMCGHDLYFQRRWTNAHRGWFWRVEMAATNFHFQGGIHWKLSGPGGGMSHDYDGEEKFLPGRRLWDGAKFIGAFNVSLKMTNKTGSLMQTEEFSDLKKIGTFMIPQKIVFVDWDKQRFTYTINKVEFRNEPDAVWFVKTRNMPRIGYSAQDEQKYISERSGSKTNN